MTNCKMPNANIPEPFEVLVPKFFFEGYYRDYQRFNEEFLEGLAIGVTALPGQVLSFHVLLRNGALWSRVPIQYVKHASARGKLTSVSSGASFLPIHVQRWDCQGSPHIYIHEALRNCTVSDEQGLVGTYLFTVDTTYPGVGEYGHKTLNVIHNAEGDILALPNTGLFWNAPAFVDRTIHINTESWKPISKIWSVG